VYIVDSDLLTGSGKATTAPNYKASLLLLAILKPVEIELSLSGMLENSEFNHP
jgi:hypothetical protein